MIKHFSAEPKQTEAVCCKDQAILSLALRSLNVEVHAILGVEDNDLSLLYFNFMEEVRGGWNIVI